jgi:hypothetical protein
MKNLYWNSLGYTKTPDRTVGTYAKTWFSKQDLTLPYTAPVYETIFYTRKFVTTQNQFQYFDAIRVYY